MDSWQIAIVLSKNIRPYNLAREGIEEVVKKNQGKLVVFQLENYEGEKKAFLESKLKEGLFSMAIGVGPEATNFLWSTSLDAEMPLLYTMVLHPESIVHASSRLCGVSLFIPIEKRLELLKSKLGNLKKLGLLFNPLNNRDFYLQALKAGKSLDIEICPLKIKEQKQVPRVLSENWGKIDALWLIPDQTVISKKLVEYIIKQGLYNKRPVIGYNQFFYNSGAALVFRFDYVEIGKQTGRLAVKTRKTGVCTRQSPRFEVMVNQKVLDRLNINLNIKKW